MGAASAAGRSGAHRRDRRVDMGLLPLGLLPMGLLPLGLLPLCSKYIAVCSFRVQYLGSSAQGQNEDLHRGWTQRRLIAYDLTRRSQSSHPRDRVCRAADGEDRVGGARGAHKIPDRGVAARGGHASDGHRACAVRRLLHLLPEMPVWRAARQRVHVPDARVALHERAAVARSDYAGRERVDIHVWLPLDLVAQQGTVIHNKKMGLLHSN